MKGWQRIRFILWNTIGLVFSLNAVYSVIQGDHSQALLMAALGFICIVVAVTGNYYYSLWNK